MGLRRWDGGRAAVGAANVSVCSLHLLYALSSPAEWGALLFVDCVGEEEQFCVRNTLMCAFLCVCVCCAVYLAM